MDELYLYVALKTSSAFTGTFIDLNILSIIMLIFGTSNKFTLDFLWCYEYMGVIRVL